MRESNKIIQKEDKTYTFQTNMEIEAKITAET